MPTRPISGWFALGVTAVLGLLLVLTQPAFLVPGDPTAVRLEAIYLVKHGRLGVPLGDQEYLAPALPPNVLPGQYFFQNNTRQVLFSRWGLFATLLFVPPVALTQGSAAHLQLLVLNLYNVFWSMVLVVGLILAMAQHARSRLALLAVLGATVLGSHVLFYLRAQTLEVFQLTLLTWAVVLFQEARVRMAAGGDHQGVLVRTAVVVALLGWLFLIKVYFLPLMFLATALLWWTARCRAQPPPWHLLGVSIPVITIALVARGIANVYQFDDMWEPGIGARSTLEAAGNVSPRWVPGCLSEFAVGPQASLFLYSPIVLVALLGLVSLFRKDPVVATFVAAPQVLLLGVTSMARNCLGGWSHGPRLLLPAVPLLAIFALVAVEKGREVHRGAMRWLPAGLTLMAVLVGGWMQLQMMRHEPFAYYKLMIEMEEATNGSPEVVGYFASTPQPWVMRDLHGLCTGGDGGALEEMMAAALPGVSPERRESILKTFGSTCLGNFYLQRFPPW